MAWKVHQPKKTPNLFIAQVKTTSVFNDLQPNTTPKVFRAQQNITQHHQFPTKKNTKTTHFFAITTNKTKKSHQVHVFSNHQKTADFKHVQISNPTFLPSHRCRDDTWRRHVGAAGTRSQRRGATWEIRAIQTVWSWDLDFFNPKNQPLDPGGLEGWMNSNEAFVFCWGVCP